MASGPGAAADGLAADQDAGRTGAGDDDVGVGDLGLEGAQRRPARGVLTGQALGALGRAVDHDDLAGPAAYDGRDGEAGHAAGTDDHDPAAHQSSAARSRAAETRVGAARSMPVSAWARLPTRSACWKRVLRVGPTEPSSWPRPSASRVWPRIWASPTAIESRPAATWKRWETAPSS